MKSTKENITGLVLDRNKERLLTIDLPVIERTRIYESDIGKTTLTDKYGEMIFFGDWHIGSEAFAENPFEAHIKHIEANPHMRVIGMGDYINYNITTKHINDETLTTDQQINRMVDALIRIGDQIVIMLPGNHAAGRMAAATKSNRWLKFVCLEAGLDVGKIFIPEPDRGCSALVNVGEYQYSLYAIHGSSGSVVNSNNQLRKMAQTRRESLLAMGHIHRILFEPRVYEELELIDDEVYRTLKKQFWLASGSYLKDSAYAEIKSYPMSIVGSPIVRFFATTNEMDMHTLPYRSRDFTDYVLENTIPNDSTFSGKKYVEEERPPCPACESDDIMSRGKQWFCKKCGRYFKK